MRTLLIPSTLIALASFTFAFDPPKPPQPVKPVFKMAKETTFITGPLDKDGYPDYETALNETLRGTIKPESNACALIWKALGPTPEGGRPPHADYWKWIGSECPPEKGDYFIDAFKFFRAAGRTEFTESDYDQHSQLSYAPWPEAAYRDYVAWLESVDKPLAIVAEAVKRKHYFSPMISRTKDGKPGMLLGVLLPQVQKSRELGDAFVKRAMLRTGQEKYAEAWADLLACHRLARHIGRGNTLIELLVGIALDAIACKADLAFLEFSKPSAKLVEGYLRDLDALPPLPSALEKLKLTERFIMLDALCHCRRDGFRILNGLTDIDDPELDELGVRRNLEKMNWESALRVASSWWDRMLTAASEPDRARRKRMQETLDLDFKRATKDAADAEGAVKRAIQDGKIDEFVSEKVGQIFISLLMPSSVKVLSASERSVQTLNGTRLAFALQAYRADHGQFPAVLAAVAPKYIAIIPNDFYTGKPLIYKPTESGFLLYSVGLNETDDGGKLLTDPMRDGETRGDDIGVRMPAAKK